MAVRSTVGDSLVSMIGQLGGASSRRSDDAAAQAGAVQSLAQARALDAQTGNVLREQESYDAGILAGEIQAGGWGTFDPVNNTFKTDAARLQKENPELLKRIMGPEIAAFFLTEGKDGAEDMEFVGIKEIPQEMLTGPPNIGAAGAPQAPQGSMYTLQFRRKDGKEVPGTMNASSDPNDPVITISADKLNAAVSARLGRVQALGGMDNPVSMSAAGRALATEAKIQQDLMAEGKKELDGEPVALRALYAELSTATGADLDRVVTELGYDPAALRAEKEAEMIAAYEARAAQAAPNSPGRPELTAYRGTKELLERNLAIADKALADYKAKTPPPATIPARMGGPLELRDARRPDTVAASDPKLQALQQARAAAAKELADLKPPEREANIARIAQIEKQLAGMPSEEWIMGKVKKGDAGAADVLKTYNQLNSELARLKAVPATKPAAVPAVLAKAAPPKFEWNEQNLRDAVSGKIEGMPTPEQSALLAKYAKDNNIKTAEDIKALPQDNRNAMAWVIAMNTRGTSTQRLEMFEKLSNWAQTGDVNESPLSANLAITKTQTDQIVAGTGQGNLDARWAELDQKDRELFLNYGMKTAQFNFDTMKAADAANTEIGEHMAAIREGVIRGENDLRFNPEGPKSGALIAFKAIESKLKNLPLGSPQQVAASAEYVEALMTMAAAQAQIPGKAAWWDGEKHIKNFLIRQDGQLNLSGMAESARFKWKNGVIDEIRFVEHGDTGKDTRTVVGADEFKRFVGAEKFTDIANALLVEHAKDVLRKTGVPQTQENVLIALERIKAFQQASAN